jgi:5-methylthioadenosine/S-adenosylhomocysteine deaminase
MGGPLDVSENHTTLLIGGAVVTMDTSRRVLDPGAVAIQGDRIVAIGAPDDLIHQFPTAETIDLRQHVIMPGLIDTHGHAGHGMTKALDDGNDWLDLVAELYFQESDDAFWRAESFLSALEHLEFGVTTSLSMTGSMPRVDDARYAEHAASGYAALGLRHIVALGPPNELPPWQYTDVHSGERNSVDLDGALATTAEAIDRLHGSHDGRISCYVGPSSLVSEMVEGKATDYSIAQMRGVIQLADDKGVGIHAHAYQGQLTAAANAVPDILSPRLCLAHCAGIGLDEVRIMAETGVSASHGPLTNAFVRARFPVTEALDAGVNVVISTDGSGPDRSFDLLSQGRIAAQLQRAHFADTSIMPAGKILEMMTVDAARALGLQDHIGSLEPGKKADIIALNLRSARMYPRLMIPQRIVYVGSGLDVDFMMVDGNVLMRDRSYPQVDVDTILDDAHREAVATLERARRMDALNEPEHMWGSVRY